LTQNEKGGNLTAIMKDVRTGCNLNFAERMKVFGNFEERKWGVRDSKSTGGPFSQKTSMAMPGAAVRHKSPAAERN